MRLVLNFPTAEVAPSADELLRAQGLDDLRRVAPRARGAAEEAVTLFERLAEPRALLASIERDVFRRVHLASGAPPGGSVVSRIFPRADALALYAATVGEPVCLEIGRRFAGGDPAVGFLLDAAASLAADRLSERCAEAFRASRGAASAAESFVLPYSPGYCGWPTQGQAPLFSALRPEAIGIALNPSCLMTPLKSVSGVLVAAEAASHAFVPDFEFCDACATHACRARMRSLARGGSREDGGEPRWSC